MKKKIIRFSLFITNGRLLYAALTVHRQDCHSGQWFCFLSSSRPDLFQDLILFNNAVATANLFYYPRPLERGRGRGKNLPRHNRN